MPAPLSRLMHCFCSGSPPHGCRPIPPALALSHHHHLMDVRPYTQPPSARATPRAPTPSCSVPAVLSRLTHFFCSVSPPCGCFPPPFSPERHRALLLHRARAARAPLPAGRRAWTWAPSSASSPPWPPCCTQGGAPPRQLALEPSTTILRTSRAEVAKLCIDEAERLFPRGITFHYEHELEVMGRPRCPFAAERFQVSGSAERVPKGQGLGAMVRSQSQRPCTLRKHKEGERVWGLVEKVNFSPCAVLWASGGTRAGMGLLPVWLAPSSSVQGSMAPLACVGRTAQ